VWIMNYLLIGVNIILLVSGQTLWKLGLARHPQLRGIGDAVIVMFSPWMIAGIALYVIATVIWIYLLSRMPLSLLYPIQSIAYVLAVVVSIYVFHEHVSWTRWLGVGIIMVGVGVIVK